MADDYYKTLEVAKTASPEEIQKAYRKLARKFHPDMNLDDKAAKAKFQQIQKAYDVLSEPEKRKLYDQFGPSFENMAAGAGAGGQAGSGPFPFDIEQIFGGNGPRRGTAGPGGFQFDGDLGDLFQQFTGGGRGRGRKPAAQARSNDLAAAVTIPFHTAIMGGFVDIALQRGGKNETIQVKIPPGVDSGKKIRLRGQGDTAGGTASDLIVTITVAPHPNFIRKGNNLELRLPVSVGEAALGNTVDVPTPGGGVTLKIPPNSSSGRRLRVKGQGVRLPDGEAGDLYVELQIKLPDSLDASARESIAAIEKQYTGRLRDGIAW